MRSVIFTTETITGKSEEIREFDDKTTDEEINNAFLDWLYTVANAFWTEY